MAFSGGAGESQADGRIPVVFMFQPTRFETVTGDRLAEWESYMMQNVGIGNVTDAFTLKATGSATYSWCGNNSIDECDFLEHP
ncbi:hypothetical protein [Streptosporangium sp. LJ11]|uniref:hypothetical protein n=1 Tax=Streptosporangium sp. LJ11 TaxID=3436927 RepID=UPI003F7B034B